MLVILVMVNGCGKESSSSPSKEKGLKQFAPISVAKRNKMKVWVHYMPWFEDKSSSADGKWGQHWTMANKNPDIVDASGRRQIASNYYPLIGPYASNDPEVLIYHCLMMKYAGIDGVLVDWYGVRDRLDYPLIKRNTEALIAAIEKVGLAFAIVYEDQTLKDGLATQALKNNQAIQDLLYLEKTFFSKKEYIKMKGKPLLLTFGPQVLKTPADWTEVFSRLKTLPSFFTLYGHSYLTNSSTVSTSLGEYIWIDNTPMEEKYQIKDKFFQFIAGAWPGFNDYYKEGGWGSQVLEDINYESGALLNRLLKMATVNNANYLQLITWNDFGEGTMIEPTREFGYMFLEEIQRFGGVDYSKEHLELIAKYYTLCKKYSGNAEQKNKLNQAFYYLISLQSDNAQTLLNEL